MTFDDYWKAVTDKYPHLANDAGKTAIRVESLKDLMRQSHEHGRDMERTIARFKQSNAAGRDLFEQMFGGKR